MLSTSRHRRRHRHRRLKPPPPPPPEKPEQDEEAGWAAIMAALMPELAMVETVLEKPEEEVDQSVPWYQ